MDYNICVVCFIVVLIIALLYVIHHLLSTNKKHRHYVLNVLVLTSCIHIKNTAFKVYTYVYIKCRTIRTYCSRSSCVSNVLKKGYIKRIRPRIRKLREVSYPLVCGPFFAHFIVWYGPILAGPVFMLV